MRTPDPSPTPAPTLEPTPTSGCDPLESTGDSPRERLRSCWTSLNWLADQAASDLECGERARDQLLAVHRGALDDLAENTLAFTHEGAGHGVVAIDSAACTLCAQCAQTCPTGAIAAAYDGERVTLSFVAASCTNCSQCVIACPEIARGAIRVSSTVDTGLLRSARFALNEGTVLVCESCGKPIAPSSMMERIGELLGDDFGDTMSYLSRRCLDCRGLT